MAATASQVRRGLDAPLVDALDEIGRQPGVSGALFVDKNGLCIAVTGDADARLAGYLALVAAQTGTQQPTVNVTIDDGRQILVHKENELTVAIFKRVK